MHQSISIYLSAASMESQSSLTDQFSCLRLEKLDTPRARGTSTPLSDESSVGVELCSQSQGENHAVCEWSADQRLSAVLL